MRIDISLLPALAAAGFGAATVIAFWISVIHGLFGVKETATGSSEVLAQVAEYSAAVFGLAVAVLLFLQPRLTTRSQPSSAPANRSVVATHIHSQP